MTPLDLIVAHNLRVSDPVGNHDPMRTTQMWRVTAHHRDGVRLPVVVCGEAETLEEAVKLCVEKLHD
jgi:hypothetical protein